MAGSFDGRTPTRGVEQAIVALKKGSHLLKCGKRGKPKFCAFRLSSDETTLIWYSKGREKHLSLSSVSAVVLGQKTIKFLRQRCPEKESHSFSLIYKNGEHSLDLICSDRDQAEYWYLGLRALLPTPCSPCSSIGSRSSRQMDSCTNTPSSYIQLKSRLPSAHGTPRHIQAAMMQNCWKERQQQVAALDEEKNIKKQEQKLVAAAAREVGAHKIQGLWVGVINICKDDDARNVFLETPVEARLEVIKHYAGEVVDQVNAQVDDDDDWWEEFWKMLLEDDDEAAFIYDVLVEAVHDLK